MEDEDMAFSKDWIDKDCSTSSWTEYVVPVVVAMVMFGVTLLFGYWLGRDSVTEKDKAMLENKRLELEIQWLEQQLEGKDGVD